MDYAKISQEKHEEWNGKIGMVSRVPLETKEDLAIAYTPGVAAPCLAIQREPELSFSLTRRGNMVAVVTDGTAVLGLGDIGPEAGMPVMEGKCVLFREFAGIDAIPLCIRSHDVSEIVQTVKLLAGSFGGINLEDIAAPRCFEIERQLSECCDIPVFHDDQHGTAIVALAAIRNAAKLLHRSLEELRIVINGAGAAGQAIARLLYRVGVRQIIVCDSHGAICEGREGLNEEKRRLAEITNPEHRTGSLADVLPGADCFLGVSVGGCLTKEMIRTMAEDPMIFALANPTPEILPEEAKEAGARLIGTGRSDYPNQINNVLAFPGIFRGALDVRARVINEEMKLAAAEAIASSVPDGELSAEKLLPDALDRSVAPAVAKAVAAAAKASGAARK
ncbi:MAG: malic enzyme-like NAD(P)-binding protein [Lachnospiraceae bacterium]|nr:malic enzyme-like NAD(P)-binding protein [Lachnospiraceae bacterium]